MNIITDKEIEELIERLKNSGAIIHSVERTPENQIKVDMIMYYDNSYLDE
jgi:hypothetical protein